MRNSRVSPVSTGRAGFAVGALAAILAATTLSLPGGAATTAVSDPALQVVDAWDVTNASTFPDLGGGLLPAYRPAMTAADDGTLLIAFNTSTDALPGGQMRLIRSTDEGLTWSASTVLAEPQLFPGGSIHVQRGMTTLSDGTVLLPFNDGVNHVNFTNREAALFVARSSDDGQTWDGLTDPVVTPVPFRELWGGGGRIVELDDGTLVQSVWGIRELSDHWQTEPLRHESGVLRSFDGGETWPEYHQILQDDHAPPFAAFGGPGLLPGGANETAVQAMPDGTLVAFIRFETSVGAAPGRFYVSRSSDGGVTWSTPQTSPQFGQTLSTTLAPCTDHLPGDRSKILIGYRDGSMGAGVSVSFDGGITFAGATTLQNPRGTAFTAAEPEFYRRSDGRVLTVFQVQSDGEPFRLVANVLEDASNATACVEQLTAADGSAAAQPSVIVERADRADWAVPMAHLRSRHDSGATVASVIAAHASRLVCAPDDDLVLAREDGTVLAPGATLSQSGVAHGDTVRLSGTPQSGEGFVVGYTELDIAPEYRPMSQWSTACAPGATAFDYRRRSLGLRFDPSLAGPVTALEITAQSGSSRLTQGDLRLLSSADNEEYTDVDSWTLTSRVESGRLVLRFEGLSVDDPYLKIAQSFGDDAFTFVIDRPATDISVEVDGGDAVSDR